MDVSSNAGEDGAQLRESVAQAPPANSGDSNCTKKIVSDVDSVTGTTISPNIVKGRKVHHGSESSEVRENGSGSCRSKQSATQGHSALNDLTMPPPSYDKGKYRQHFYQLHRPRNPAPPPPASLDDAATIPLARANFISELLYLWISPLMTLGYQRPLQATDLWKMDEGRTAAVLAEKLQAAYEKRRIAAQAYNARLRDGKVRPSIPRRIIWKVTKGSYQEKLEAWRKKKVQKASLTWSLNEIVKKFFWVGGASKVVGDMAMLMGPLVSRSLIEFAQQRARDRSEGLPGPNVGRGIAAAIGLFLLTAVASIFTHFFFYRSMASGVMMRAALTTSIYQRAVVLSTSARVKLDNGRLMANLSTDISRVDYAAQWVHAIWTAPIQVIVCMILLIDQIGASALVGIALFACLIPIQSKLMGWQIKIRKRSMVYTDARSRTLTEILGSFAIIKYFVWEKAYLDRIAKIRGNELKGVLKISLVKSFNQSLALSLPTLAAVVAFLTYLGTGNSLNPARIFTALSLFNLLRQPLMFLPRALSASADAVNALERLTEVFEADVRTHNKIVDPSLDVAIRATDASFQWLTAEPEQEKKAKKGKQKSEKVHDKEETPSPQREPFKVEHLNMEIKRGQVCAMVGAVGSGKSSILQGLIGEMKNSGGEIKFGGKVAYCSQSAFITNASLRDNVLFGQAWDEQRYWKVLEDACLIPDCLLLPDGDLTEIGERGINISGGQKQRINVARALYFNADIVIFDDPLSAVDAHVAGALFHNAMLDALKGHGKTVLLVTHALHILPETDYIYVVDHGRIAEEGTYQELSERKAAFAHLMSEFGGATALEEEKAAGTEEAVLEEDEPISKNSESDAATLDHEQEKQQAFVKSRQKAAAGSGKLEGRLITQEKRNTGSIGFAVYKLYLHAGKAWMMIPLILATSVIMQGASVLSGLWLTYWEGDNFHKPLGFYMGLYAGIGVTGALFTFGMGVSISAFTYFASGALHKQSIGSIFFAPMSFFHSTPLGRVLGVFGKDVDVLDSQLADSYRMAAMIFGNVIGSVILLAVYFPYFLIAVFVVLFGYIYFWMYYRASSRELKRLDSLLRGLLYGHFSESLSGLATIRAYEEADRFKKENAKFMDLENRAYFLTAVNQRWLSIRVDCLGALISFAIALMCALGVNGVDSAEVGLLLSFCVQLVQAMGMVARQTAEVENYMNAVERLTYYSSANLPQEKAYEIQETAPSTDWPAAGQIAFVDVNMAYRPELPPVLKDISIDIRPGEKIGIVGRTGAGKSSIMQALFRMVELRSGKIVIDGTDIATLGLSELRKKLAIIPQDPQLFSGTIRTNLDPFSIHDDARLHDAMKRAYLIESTGEDSNEKKGSVDINVSRFTLDTDIEDGGENLSVGQRSLVSLARALVKDSKIIVLDECTASVDLETDAKIQQTITREFADKTLLCIAHRLRTILSYDRILVLEAGEILEFDTPLNLFHKQDGAFAGMCVKSAITEADIVKAAGKSL